MSFIPDLSSLDRAANTLDSHATDVRDRANQLVASMNTINWSSAGATAFRLLADQKVSNLRQCADELNQAASELRQHAATARERLAVIAATAQAVEDAAKDVAGAAEDVGSGLVSAGSAFGHGLSRIGGFL
jgi:uncharacterized protein YukE